jgi:predicted restriction endonuclease
LVAAHIKPRARCSDAERRDLSNVVPMCLFGCDAMFERGWLFIDEGKVRFRAGRELALPTKTLFESISRQILPTWKPDRMPYFRWHAAQIQD